MHRCALCRCADGRCHFTCQVLWSVAGSRTHSTCQSQLTYGNVVSSVWHGEQGMRCMVSVRDATGSRFSSSASHGCMHGRRRRGAPAWVPEASLNQVVAASSRQLLLACCGWSAG